MHIVSHDSETPAQGQQVITACAFIHRTINGVEKVFLPKRADTKKFLPGKYEIPGGHIEFGEDIQVGLKREIKEELGIDVELGNPFAVFTYMNDVKGSHSIEVVYFAQLIGEPEAITIDPSDHATYGWFDEQEALLLNNNDQDDEVAVLKKGFALLRGEQPQF
ncbi:MAG TPA: NUDIX hydrolase [Candidatus Saccharimonadales bacterium]|nr:NUDIX hydrolase [Candidatus Saccharimonadales bacterium]